MSTRRPSRRALRPGLEGLEARKLLARTISGIDVDGDAWVLRLVGPGDLRVTQQPGPEGQAVPPGVPGLIDTITIAGSDPTTTRLIGTVRQGPEGDGRVFFQRIEQLGGIAPGFPGRLGVYALDMPNFWLGQTSSEATAPAPAIIMPDGVVNLRLGGADVTYAPEGVTPPSQDGTPDTFIVSLGLPRTFGTSIVVDRVVTSAQAGTPVNGQPAPPVQDSVVFTVFGRINTFQANEIVGNPDFPPTGFATGGGTVVQSLPDQQAAVTGSIGYIRVGGDATNFSVQTNDRISDFYVGGETNFVNVLAPLGSRNLHFGRGMDNVTIRSHYIETLQANRGAVGSEVTVSRNINRMTFGGDVVNTLVLSGYDQQLEGVFQNQQLPQQAARAQAGGSINNVLVAGDIINSLFAASVEPYEGQVDLPESLLFPHSHISAKVEGLIFNDAAAPAEPNQAFFANTVKVSRGPVIPPAVPEPPFPHPNAPPSGPGIIPKLQPVARPQARAAILAAGAQGGVQTPPRVPVGPLGAANGPRRA